MLWLENTLQFLQQSLYLQPFPTQPNKTHTNMKPENKNPYEINDTQQAVPVGDNYKGYTQHNNPELSDIETFNRN
jgi:hypothetical protein